MLPNDAIPVQVYRQNVTLLKFPKIEVLSVLLIHKIQSHSPGTKIKGDAFRTDYPLLKY